MLRDILVAEQGPVHTAKLPSHRECENFLPPGPSPARQALSLPGHKEPRRGFPPPVPPHIVVLMKTPSGTPRITILAAVAHPAEMLWMPRLGAQICAASPRHTRAGLTNASLNTNLVQALSALLDRRGARDLSVRSLQSTEIGLANELVAASVMLGQAAEGRSVVIIRGSPYAGLHGTARDPQRPATMDLFR